MTRREVSVPCSTQVWTHLDGTKENLKMKICLLSTPLINDKTLFSPSFNRKNKSIMLVKRKTDIETVRKL